jgi:DUF1680 family protein
MAGFTPFCAYHQDRLVWAEIVESAVRSSLLAGVADVYLETGEKALLEAAKRLWHDMTARRMYLTAGFGSRHLGEAFGGAYELPSDTAYAETCATIASMMWNWRMLANRPALCRLRARSTMVSSGIMLDGQRYFTSIRSQPGDRTPG